MGQTARSTWRKRQIDLDQGGGRVAFRSSKLSLMPEGKRIASTTGGAQARDARAGAPREAMRVLVIAPDRGFREVASLLLTRRGCSVSVSASASMLAERVARAHTEVVVIDATASLSAAARTVAAAEALIPRVGVVVVGDATETEPLKLRIVEKWGSFDALFEAVADARPEDPELA